MIIYKTTNILNKKIYIGQTHSDDPTYLGSGSILRKAIDKNGISCFKREILEKCNSQEELNEREKYWIKRLNSQNRNIGYNILPGGQSGWKKGSKHTNETKKNISKVLKNSEAHKKAVSSKEHREKLSKAFKESPIFQAARKDPNVRRKISEGVSGEKNGNYGGHVWIGRRHSEAAKKKMSESSKGQIPWNLGETPILQYDLEGNFIKRWNNLREVNSAGFAKSNVVNQIKGKKKTAYKSIWKYETYTNI